MKQPHLPFKKKRLHTFFKVFLIIAVIAIIIALTAYSLFTYTKDDLVKYFPQDTDFFITLKFEPDHIDSDFFKRISFPESIKNQFIFLLENDIAQDVARNVGIGVLNETDIVGILYLKHSIDESHPIFSIFRSEGYDSFKITSKIAKKEFIVISNSTHALDQIKEVIENNKKGLEQNLSLTLGRHFISELQGIVYLNDTMVSKLYKTLPSEFIDESHVPQKAVTLGFDIDQDAIVLKTSGYKSKDEISIPHSPTLEYGLHVIDPIKRINENVLNEQNASYINAYNVVNELNLDELITKLKVSSAQYVNLGEKKEVLSIQTTTPQATKESIMTFTYERLANIRQKSVQKLADDGTVINVIEKNRDEITKNDEIIKDLTQNDTYSFEIFGNLLRIGKNVTNDEIIEETITGCHLNDEADYVIATNSHISTVPVLGEIADLVIFSTYPQGYPQFLLCIK